MPEVARGTQQDSVSTGHLCDATPTTNVCSTSVFVNGIGACRLGDAVTTHTVKIGSACVPHIAIINAGSSSVFVDGIAIARNGDSADSGSSTVFAG